ncbi:MAG: hypothetical protein AB7V26_14430 [Lysobacterales bacterium]
MAKPTPSMDKQQSEASFDRHRVAQPSLVAYARPGHPLPVVRSCSRCLGASAERTPSPSSITTTTYAYDRDDRLIQTTVSHQPSDASTPDERSDWTLDAVGNRLTETVTRLPDNTTTSNKSYIYSDRDQLLTMTDTVNQLTVEYSYDQNGNRVSRTVTRQGQPPETTTYTFDARDRLTGVQPNAPTPRASPTNTTPMAAASNASRSPPPAKTRQRPCISTTAAACCTKRSRTAPPAARTQAACA